MGNYSPQGEVDLNFPCPYFRAFIGNDMQWSDLYQWCTIPIPESRCFWLEPESRKSNCVGIGIGVESENFDWNQNQKFKKCWNRNRNEDIPGIVHHWPVLTDRGFTLHLTAETMGPHISWFVPPVYMENLRFHDKGYDLTSVHVIQLNILKEWCG